jgi:hypothetical protein
MQPALIIKEEPNHWQRPMHAETIGVDLQVGLFVLQAATQLPR